MIERRNKIEYKFIKFNDNKEIMINILDVSLFFNEKINGSNPYFNITFLFKNGNNLTLRYELVNEDKYNEDVNYLNSLKSRR